MAMYFRQIRPSQNILINDFKHDRGCLLRAPGFLSFICNKSDHSIQYKPYVPQAIRDHDHKNMKLKRPMSPHVTMYGPTLPAMTSIAQRATGAILTFYAFGLACGSLFLSNGVETYVSMIQSLHLGRLTIFLLKVILGAPFCFHYFNAFRYIAWNAARMLELKQVYETSRQAMIAAAALTIFFALV